MIGYWAPADGSAYSNEAMQARHPQPLIGIVLCGGAGRRMGGADKPLQPWRGQTMVAQVVARLQPQVDRVLISANRNHARYAQYGSVVSDRWPGFEGPLAGIASAVRSAAAGSDARFLVCPGDSPELPLDLGQRLAAAPENDPPRYIHDGDRPQPLFALLHSAHLASLEQYLRDGRRSVIGWLEAQGAEPVRDPRPKLYRNLNGGLAPG